MSASTSIGPVSGIDYGNLVNGLTAVDQAMVNSVLARANRLNAQDTALTTLNTLMTGLKVSAASFTSSAIFRATTATSGNSNILTAVGGIGTPTGNYTFDVQRLAAASQQVTQGFSSSTNPLGLSGTFTIQAGGKLLSDVAQLTQLNGGNGIARGSIRITDASGASAQVDLSNAVDVNDVITAINSASGVQVTAKIDGDHLVLTDNSGGAGSLKVANVGGTTTASDLGLTGAAAGSTLTGTSLTMISSSTTLNSLNDGNGVRSNNLGDFSITGADGTAVNVTLNTAKTVGDVIKAINTNGSAHGISAAISADGTGITISDANGGPISVAAQNGSFAAYDLGILGNSATGSLVGSQVSNELSGPLLTDLNGGYQGTGSTVPQYGTIQINGTSVDLTNARGIQDVIGAINNSGTGVTAAINDSGTGITLSSNSSSFTVADGTSNLASFLHIAGTSTATATGSSISSGNLHTRYISNNTLLSTLNGGQGVTPGVIQITDGFGTTKKLDLTTGISTIGDVINAINASGLKITAGVNSTGDGILLTQNGGTGTANVSDTNGGKEASQLGIAGSFTNGTLDGTFQKTVSVTASDTLSTIASKISSLGIGAAASVINDGSGANPYRLNISSRSSGYGSRIVFDGSGAGLSTTSLVQGQDAVVVYGGNSNGTGGLLTTSTTNSITGLIPSMTLNLTGVGTTSVAVTNDTSKITDAVQTFVTNYNDLINGISTATQFNSTNPSNSGILFGNSTVEQIQGALGRFVNQSYTGYGQYTSLASIGITVGQDGTLSLDTDTLNAALTADPTDVQKLFTTNTPAVTADLTKSPPVLPSPAVKGIGAVLSDLASQFTDSHTGVLFEASQALESQEQQINDRANSLNSLLSAKKNLLIAQFANLESTIAGLQSQGNAISSLSSTVSSSSSKKSG